MSHLCSAALGFNPVLCVPEEPRIHVHRATRVGCMRSRHGAADHQQTAAQKIRLKRMSVDDGAQRLLIITGEVCMLASFFTVVRRWT